MPVQSIGAYEAKTKLPELLRRVQAGQEFEISVRGHVVAKLSPIPPSVEQASVASDQMKNFMQAQQRESAGEGVDLRAWIDEGRP